MIGEKRELQVIDSSSAQLTHPSGGVGALLAVGRIPDNRTITHLLTARPWSHLQHLQQRGLRNFRHWDFKMPIRLSSLGEHDGRNRQSGIVNLEF